MADRSPHNYPHPYLYSPSLFICHLPNHVQEAHLENLFKSLPGATFNLHRTKSGRNRGTLRATLNFPDLHSTERALATLHLRPIPDTEPPALLKFSTTFNLQPFNAPEATVQPRLVQILPAGYTEAMLFDLLRPFGPVYSVSIDPITGGLVQFWTESHAQEAESQLAATRPKFLLQVYDRCSIFCSNISLDIDSTALRTHFTEYGNITSVEILTLGKTGKSRGLGFITFTTPSEASAAMKAMHGAEIQWKRLSVTYSVLRDAKPSLSKAGPYEGVSPGAKAKTKPSPEKERLPPTTQDAAGQDIRNKDEVPTGQTSAPQTDRLGDISDVREELERFREQYEFEVKLRTEAQAENMKLRAEIETLKRALEMSESRLKILQLERDRPLWEEAKKKREMEEKEELAKQEERRRETEVQESRRKMQEFKMQEERRKHVAEEAKQQERLRREAEEKARREQEERERKAREKAERERKQKEEREKREREKRWRAATNKEEARCQRREEQLWGTGEWSDARALERLKVQMDEFDKIKFSEAQPLTFGVIPWPVLVDPLDMDVEQVDWSAVETFFARVKVRTAGDPTEYRALVEKVHRMFHPDKWKARGVLTTVMDEDLRASLETAGNVVAQAMTPLWRKSKGYT
ncbi:hypothetical protein B0H10DRAFT_1360693 [Mycena sp. CBHHK59/15]|nr:hypothetical protein B0H10DRAFT_1360693 [Mycena sp. CBHHK59/15]